MFFLFLNISCQNIKVFLKNMVCKEVMSDVLYIFVCISSAIIGIIGVILISLMFIHIIILFYNDGSNGSLKILYILEFIILIMALFSQFMIFGHNWLLPESFHLMDNIIFSSIAWFCKYYSYGLVKILLLIQYIIRVYTITKGSVFAISKKTVYIIIVIMSVSIVNLYSFYLYRVLKLTKPYVSCYVYKNRYIESYVHYIHILSDRQYNTVQYRFGFDTIKDTPPHLAWWLFTGSIYYLLDLILNFWILYKLVRSLIFLIKSNGENQSNALTRQLIIKTCILVSLSSITSIIILVIAIINPIYSYYNGLDTIINAISSYFLFSGTHKIWNYIIYWLYYPCFCCVCCPNIKQLNTKENTKKSGNIEPQLMPSFKEITSNPVTMTVHL